MNRLNETLTDLTAAPAGPDLRERSAWARIKGVWKPLHGSFPRQGLSVEWHDFRVDKDMNWSRSFHPGSLEICLNFSGSGTLRDGAAVRPIGPNQGAMYTQHGERLRAIRDANSLHRFLTVELAPEFLRVQFADELALLKPAIRRFIETGHKAPPYLEILPLPASLLASRVQFVDPPVPEPARKTWYLGRVLEILAQTLFPAEDPNELFCHKHQRTNRSRIDRVRYLLERDLENPPSLEMLAEEVGCSPFYLSRIFAQEAGASIPKFLRMKRVEKAAEFLRTGKMNVTEAAVALGYSSLSAFSKAFVEHFGCCPGLYPHFKIPGREASKGQPAG